MILLSNDELKRVALGVLIAVDRFCKQEGLTYYLAYGSLLGAKRHGGFIPWDDDIDILMPRSDYEVFKSSFKYPGMDCSFVSSQSPEYTYPFVKVWDTRTVLIEEAHRRTKLGVFVDIFPLDNVGSNMTQASRSLDSLAVKRRMLIASSFTWNRHWSLPKNLSALCLSFYAGLKSPKRRLSDLEDKIFSLSEESDAAMYCNAVDYTYGIKDCHPISVFGPGTKINFEGWDFNAPADVDGFLSAIYGDYMSFPPVESRVTHHDFVAYWR